MLTPVAESVPLPVAPALLRGGLRQWAAAARRGLLTVVATVLACGASMGALAQGGAADPRFDVFEYRVEGNTVLPAEAIERAVYPFLGEKRTVADVEQARAALEAVYRAAGYSTVAVDTPEQRIVDAVVVLQVVEAPVSRLRVVGSRYYSQSRIVAAVPSLAEGQVPNFTAAAQELAAINQSADRRVTPLIRPGKEPRTTEVDLNVEDRRPLHGSVELNNKASAGTSSTRLLASLRYDNLLQREHSIGLQLQTSPEAPSEVKVISGSYTIPSAGGPLIATWLRSESNTVAGGAGGTSVFGKGSVLGLRKVFVLEASEQAVQTLSVAGDYKNFDESVSVGTNEGFTTPIRYLPLSVSYSLTQGARGDRWSFGAGLTFAVRDLASDASQFANKRFRGLGNFALIKLDAGRTLALPHGMEFAGRVDAQLTHHALVSNEQFVAGGADSVRGYLESSVVGDQGLRFSLELRSPDLTRGAARLQWLGEARAHVFLEGAAMFINDALPGQDSRLGLLSTGAGLRVRRDAYALSLDLGWALHNSIQTRRGDLRVHASGSFEF